MPSFVCRWKKIRSGSNAQARPYRSDFWEILPATARCLLIKEHGGHLAKTPVYGIQDNFQYTKARVNLTSEGNATAEISRKFGGLQFDENRDKLTATPEDQKEWLYDYLKIPNFKISHSDFKQKNPDLPESVLNVNLDMASYCSTSGNACSCPSTW